MSARRKSGKGKKQGASITQCGRIHLIYVIREIKQKKYLADDHEILKCWNIFPHQIKIK